MSETLRVCLWPRHVLHADDAPSASGFFIDALGRIGVAAGSSRVAVNLDSQLATEMGELLVRIGRHLAAAEAAAARGKAAPGRRGASAGLGRLH